MSNNVAVITGAASGIGRAISEKLINRYQTIILIDIDEFGLSKTEEKIHSVNNDTIIIPIKCDVTNNIEIKEKFEKIKIEVGRIDALINSAGIEIMSDLEEMTEQQWDLQMGVNLKSMFLCSKYAIPELKKNGGGIVNIASVLGIIVAPQHVAYCASKGGVLQFTKALGFDLAPYNIRVNAVLPGPIDTPMYRKTMEDYPDPTKAHNEHIRSIPIGRIGQPIDIANAVDFLCSPESSFITCSSLLVDGGFTASKVSLE